jgi:hypothetical protein
MALSMCDDLMPNLKLRLTMEEFHRLPRHPAYKYEYVRGQAHLTPRPKHYHALLELKADTLPRLEGAEPEIAIRRIEAGDRDCLERLFAVAFQRQQPFASLDEKALKEAVRTCLDRTLTGGDGPWIEQASFLAVGEDNRPPVGASSLRCCRKAHRTTTTAITGTVRRRQIASPSAWAGHT